MGIKGVFCTVGAIISVLCVGSLWLLGKLSIEMQQKQTLIVERQASEEEIINKTTRLTEVEYEIAKHQVVIADYDAQLRQLGAKQIEIQNAMESKRALYDIYVSGMPINYDVENFRTAEKLNSQTNQLVGSFLGKLFENLMNDDETSNVASAERLRLSLYEKLSDFLDDSYREFAAAKVAYDGSYDFYHELAQAKNDEELLANAEMLKKVDISRICTKEQEDLLHALGKYAFDLSIVSIIYDNTLTENEIAFLTSLQSQLQNLQEILVIYDAEESVYGYTQEEKLSRYKTMMKDYVEIEWELASRNADGGIKWGSTITDYGNSVNKGYFNKSQIVIMEQQIVNSTSVRVYFYNRQGNPIYADFEPFDLVILDGVGYEVAPNANSPREHEWLQQWVDEAIEVKDKYCDAFYGDGRY